MRVASLARLLYLAVAVAQAAVLSVPDACGQVPIARRSADSATHGAWGDQGDGTYANPVLPGDFSDLDAIRVGSDYYAISSTLQYSPGVAVLHSNDLVNWQIAGHVVPDLTIMDAQLNWNTMNRPGRGVWAGALRHHAGKFWVYFGTPDQGIWMSTATSAAGPWTKVRLVYAAAGWDDPCPFWDDDGQLYLVATHFAPEVPAGTQYNIHLFKLNAAGDQVLPSSDRILHRSPGSEANKLYKIAGRYYHFYSEIKPEGRVAMMERSRSLAGPWAVRQLNHVHPLVDKEPNQGGLIELRSGKWYFLTHQGTGDWEGRAGVLLPVAWIDGWPVIGRVGADGIGNMVWRGRKPVNGSPRSLPSASDTFDAPQLQAAWEWNYQPRAGYWSLAEKRGSLRLRAFPPLRPNAFSAIGNVLTQRAYRTGWNQVTIQLGLRGMVDGQQAGLAHFAATAATLAVAQQGSRRVLQFEGAGVTVRGPVVTGDVVFLRSSWGFDGVSHFSYSFDGRSFKPFGTPYLLTWGAYRGDRIGIFTVNSKAAAGYVDIDAFAYRIQR